MAYGIKKGDCNLICMLDYTRLFDSCVVCLGLILFSSIARLFKNLVSSAISGV